MVNQVSNEQVEISKGGNLELFKASALGFGLVSGYFVAGFAAIIYLLWLITNMYSILIGGSILYQLFPYTSIWIGLLLTIVFIVLNVLILAAIIYLIGLISKIFKSK